jgi:hypothetical protein
MFESDSARYAVYYFAALRPWDPIAQHYKNHVAWHLYEVREVYPIREELFQARLRAGLVQAARNIGIRDTAPVRERMVGWWELRERFTFGSSP